MRELSAIIKAYGGLGAGTPALATVVRTTGSSYRRPGARMLILPDGGTVGSISGGCLERDVISSARGVVEQGKAVLLTYDTTLEEDIVFGVGLGCKGVVEILVEPLVPGSEPAGMIAFVENMFRRRQSGAVATIVRVEGRVAARLGDRLMLDEGGGIVTRFRNENLRSRVLAETGRVFRKGLCETVGCELATGVVEVFIEVLHSPTPLVIFGAGYDARPLVRLAKEVGFEVTVVDGRPAYATSARFPEADTVVLARPEDELRVRLRLNDRTTAVIMSHHYLTDCGYLRALMPVPLRYLGLMGPRRRAEKMLLELGQEGISATEVSVNELHNPVGLDIGAEGPEQIALAILAEIQAVLSGHAGGLLRKKAGPIHSPAGADGGRTQAQTTCPQG